MSIFSGLHIEIPHLLEALDEEDQPFCSQTEQVDFLLKFFLPQWIQTNITEQLNIWNPGCGYGVDAYSLSIVLLEYKRGMPEFLFHILATDFSADNLAFARKAIYKEQLADYFSSQLKKRYMLRSKDRQAAKVRFTPQVRGAISFRQVNILDNFCLREKPDIVLCRNLLHYFELDLRSSLLRRICLHLQDRGIIIMRPDLEFDFDALQEIGPGIYRLGA